MAPKCTICGADDATTHVCAGDLEETYQRDLRDLAARSRETLAPPPPPDDAALEAPASVREAIRLADTLIPVAQPEALLVAALAIGDPPPQWGKRLAVAGVVVGGAIVCAALWHADGRAPVAATGAAAAAVAAARPVDMPAPVRVEAPVTEATATTATATARVEAPRAGATGRKATAPGAKPRPAVGATATGATATGAATAAMPTAQPTLMEAIVSSVATARRAPAGGAPTR
jgi:hypothetical protein